jgi:signal transduction histidine kinase
MGVLGNSPNTSEIYKFSILTIFSFFVSVFFNPMLQVLAQDSIFYINMIGALLCLILLLKDAWIQHEKQESAQNYLWGFILWLCLPFTATFIMVRSDYSPAWIMNAILVNTLLYFTLRSLLAFVILLITGVLTGLAFGIALNLYFPISSPITIQFALYSCTFFLARIALVIHDHMYIEKHMYKMVKQEVFVKTKDLQEALEIKNEFLDNISHEIRIPVHNITNIVSELHDQWKNISSHDKLEMVRMLKQSNSRLLSLCSNLLDLSKLTKGHGVEIKKYEIITLIEALLSEYENFAQLISIKVASKRKRFVSCDKEKTLQVLRNLLDNAIKYGKGSSIEIYVNNKSNDSITFSIADGGVGIPTNELEMIFNPFEQSSSTKTKAGGTGLGLAICKKIVECHKGKIWAENNEARGATFFFTLPNPEDTALVK